MINSQTISVESIVGQVEGNIVSDMGGEKVMLSISNGKYYNLGEIGGVIWDAIQQPLSFSELIDNLLNEYQVDRETCEQQVLTFLEMLLEEEIILIRS
ncbi:lasso peptide biosynthesis PqqD family chaperone [Rossellomorea aquimaris]|uniref:Coenzyme PQQ synthesis protein D (PqqD) n=1 Tax=Rossellomorea aquimaris TaxID=189382 RepID=A0A366ENW6_9BACI|nr:lasso peptide biosynthesis PqqD family chaperone [Rossellomorea aquimaris]RBP03165.1 coenzyme PQQ synthesis protein D (PqqD) [Rossellomorea aquimaris]